MTEAISPGRLALWPVLVAAMGLAGSVASTQLLSAEAESTLARVLDERLRGAGEAATTLLARGTVDGDQLAALMKANALDGAWLVDERRRVLADASGEPGGRLDLLRVDVDRLQRAFDGETGIGVGWSPGDEPLATGYFPLHPEGNRFQSVLVLEAGQAFAGEARQRIVRARRLGLGLGVVASLALAVVAARLARSLRQRQEDEARTARAEMLSRMAAAVAHDIRNPLGVIRGTVELTRRRSAASLSERDDEALKDILGEVERLRRLTDDFMDLAAERPLSLAPVELGGLLAEAARALEAGHPGVTCRVEGETAPVVVMGDAGRLMQLFRNLLDNAAAAKPDGLVRLVRLAPEGGKVAVRVVDEGPGVPDEVRSRLFEPFVTARKSNGTGLGLAICRSLAERQGGSVALLASASGATFEVRLPTADGES
jgi:two-component system OmpR family sensor kinase